MAVDGQRAVTQLADQLSDGFLALSVEYRLLREQHRQLEDQLSWAKKQHEDILRKFSPNTAEEAYGVYLDDLLEAGKETSNSSTDWLEPLAENPTDGRSSRAFLIRQAELANETLKQLAETRQEEGVRIWSGPSADKEETNGASYQTPSNTAKNDPHAHLEKDFTVPGTPSKLGCPFAKVNGHRTSLSGGKHSLATPRSSSSKMSRAIARSKRSSFNDPIKAELNGIQEALSAEPSIEGSAGACPIRFLDQHSPEEVAQYFENHKHEIPRSHEICIKRFQSNSDQIRKLDAKYGNLVSMIQGLGHKHQAWLPEKPNEEEDALGGEDASDKVKNWAEGVSASLNEGEPGDLGGKPEPPDTDDARDSHFDRPLKEVRVGESPSRPWGITVPSKYAKSATGASAHSPATASPLDSPIPVATARPTGCPFDHTKLQAQVSDMPDFETTKPDFHHPPNALKPPLAEQPQPGKQAFPDPPKPVPVAPTGPQMVFMGPVFFGYSPETIQQFLGQTFAKPS